MKGEGGTLGLIFAVLLLSGCDAGMNSSTANAPKETQKVSATFDKPGLRVRARFEKPGLRFTASECDRSTRTPSTNRDAAKSGREGVKSSAWRSDGVLEVNAALVENCAVQFKDAGFSISGNALSLAYAAGVEVAPAACNCVFGLRYEIGGIPRGDYAVQFRGTGMEPD